MDNLYEIPGVSGYLITENGQVFSISTSKILTTKIKNGYKIIEYYVNGQRKRKYIHRILAQLFLPLVSSKPVINHINGIKTDNRIQNLEWCTQSENVKHAFATGLCANRAGIVGIESHRAKITEDDVRAIRKSTCSQRSLALKYNIPSNSICLIRNMKSWKHVKDA